MLGDSQRAVGGEITVFNKAWNGLGKVGGKSQAKYGSSNAQRDFRPLSRESA